VKENQVACGGNDKYCEAGSGTFTDVPSGWMTVGGDSSTRTSAVPCNLGTYCVDGVSHDCPAGSYSDSKGLTECVQCSEGYFCPSQSSSSTQESCGGGSDGSSYLPAATYYCPAGTSTRKQVASGYYTTPVNSNPVNRIGQAQAKQGFVVVSGQREPAVQWKSADANGIVLPCAGQGLPTGDGGNGVGPQPENVTSYGLSYVREDAVANAIVQQVPVIVSSGTGGSETALSSVTYSIVSQSRATDPMPVGGDDEATTQT